MGHLHPTGGPLNLNDLLDSLERGEVLRAVNMILGLSKDHAIKFIGGTTITAYRRVHEVITSALDEITKRMPSKSPEEVRKELGAIELMIARSLILINYQEAREQISENLARLLKGVMETVSKVLAEISKPGTQDLNRLIERANKARSVLDSVAVLVYKYGR